MADLKPGHYSVKAHVSSTPKYEMYGFFAIMAYLCVLYSLFIAANRWFGWLVDADGDYSKNKHD